LPRNATGRRQPVHVDDLAAAAFAVLGTAAAHGQTYALPGGETLPYREMVQRVLPCLNRRRRWWSCRRRCSTSPWRPRTRRRHRIGRSRGAAHARGPGVRRHAGTSRLRYAPRAVPAHRRGCSRRARRSRKSV
jgi:uncharacterized protein YbjT (DUF2867 family)